MSVVYNKRRETDRGARIESLFLLPVRENSDEKFSKSVFMFCLDSHQKSWLRTEICA